MYNLYSISYVEGDPMGVRNRFLEIRLQRGFKLQKDFASYLGLTQSHYNRYERNLIQPNLSQVYKILKILNINFYDLFYLEE